MRSNSIEEILQNKIDLLHKQIELEVKEKYHLYKRIKELNDEIAELKKISDIEIGDIVLTSNLSIYFPPNLPVGEVVSIFEKSDSSNRVVKMKLFSDLSTINQLFVLLNEVEE